MRAADRLGRAGRAAIMCRVDWPGCFGEGERGVVAETDGGALTAVGALGPVSSTGHRMGKGGVGGYFFEGL